MRYGIVIDEIRIGDIDEHGRDPLLASGFPEGCKVEGPTCATNTFSFSFPLPEVPV